MNQLICYECHKRIDMHLIYHPSPQNPTNRICDFCYYKDHLDQLADEVYKLLKSVDVNDRMRILKLLTFYDKQINQIASEFLKTQHRQIYNSLIISTQPQANKTTEIPKLLPAVELPDAKYWCPNCKYQTDKKSSYQDHLKSRRHLKNTGCDQIAPRKERSDKGTKKKVVIVGRVNPPVTTSVRIPTPPLNEPWGDTPESVNFETPDQNVLPEPSEDFEEPEEHYEQCQEFDNLFQDSEISDNDDPYIQSEEPEDSEEPEESEELEEPDESKTSKDSEESEESEETSKNTEEFEESLSMDSELEAILQSSDDENSVTWKILPNPNKNQTRIEIRPSTPPIINRRSLHPSPIKITMASLPPPPLIFPNTFIKINAPNKHPASTSKSPTVPASKSPVVSTSTSPVVPASKSPTVSSSKPQVVPDSKSPVVPASKSPVVSASKPQVVPDSKSPVVSASKSPASTFIAHPITKDPTPVQSPSPSPSPSPSTSTSKELPLNIIKQYPSQRIPDFSIADTLDVLTYRAKELSSARYLNLQTQEKQFIDRILASLLNHATHPNHFKRIYQYIITKGAPNAIKDRLAQLFYELDQNLSKNPKSVWTPIHPIIKRFTTYYCANGQVKQRQVQRR